MILLKIKEWNFSTTQFVAIVPSIAKESDIRFAIRNTWANRNESRAINVTIYSDYINIQIFRIQKFWFISFSPDQTKVIGVI